MSHRAKKKFAVRPPESRNLGPFALEIFVQCYAATQFWNRALENLMRPPVADIEPHGEVPPEALVKGLQIVADLQGFLASAGILSDIFFPDKRGDQARGEELCARFLVRPGSPLSGKKQGVRNSFMHVDERLDRWLPTVAGVEVGPFAILGSEEADRNSGRYLRVVDKEGWRLLAMGESLDLFPLLEEIQRVFDLVAVQAKGPDGVPRYTMRSDGLNRDWKPPP